METAVLVFTTHGDIQVRNSRNPELTEEVEDFLIPEGIEIVILNAVSPGVPNLLPPKNVAPFVKIIRNATSRFNVRTPMKEMKEIVKTIKSQIFERDDQPENVAKEIRSANELYTNDGEIMAYHNHSHEFLYKISSYTNEQRLPNKEYLREDKLLYKNGENKKIKNSNWKLNLLNSSVETDEDLMDTLNPNAGKLRTASLREGFTITRLETVINELHRRGIRKLIIIDLTCSVIRNKQLGITDRGERNIAFTLRKEQPTETPIFGGKKTMKRKRKINNRKRKNKTIRHSPVYNNIHFSVY
jgi:hypothetical protein